MWVSACTLKGHIVSASTPPRSFIAAHIFTSLRRSGHGARPSSSGTRITFDDGRSWQPVKAPSQDAEGKRVHHNQADSDICQLHFHCHNSPQSWTCISLPCLRCRDGIAQTLRRIRHFPQYRRWPYLVHDQTGRIQIRVQQFLGPSTTRRAPIVSATPRTLAKLGERLHKLLYAPLLIFFPGSYMYRSGVGLRVRILVTVSDSTSQKSILIVQLGGNRRVGVASRRCSLASQTRDHDYDFEHRHPRNAN